MPQYDVVRAPISSSSRI